MGTPSMMPTSGVAAFTGLAIDSIGNGYSIQATSAGLASATTNLFDVTAAAASRLLVTAGPPSSVTAGDAFGLTITAEDPFGNVATAYGGTIDVALKNDPGGGTLAGTTSMTPTQGVATFSRLELDTAGDSYTIQVTSTGLTGTISGSFDVTPAAASKLVVTTLPPSAVTAGDRFGLAVTAEDRFGNAATAFAGSIGIALKNNPGGGTLGGTSSMMPTNGVATFSDLELDKAASGYTIQATSTGLTAATTGSFDVTPAAASQLLITAQPPSSVTAGNSFGLTVTAEDRFGNLATEFEGGVAVALQSNPTGASLGGTVNSTARSGVAVFAGLTLDRAANGYSIQGASAGLSSATTSSFDVTPAAFSQFVVTTQPPASVPTGKPFGLAVSAEDPYGNVVTTVTGNMKVALSKKKAGVILSGKRTVALNNGVATFTRLSLNKAGKGYKLKATGPDLLSALTNPFDVTASSGKQANKQTRSQRFLGTH